MRFRLIFSVFFVRFFLCIFVIVFFFLTFCIRGITLDVIYINTLCFKPSVSRERNSENCEAGNCDYCSNYTTARLWKKKKKTLEDILDYTQTYLTLCFFDSYVFLLPSYALAKRFRCRSGQSPLHAQIFCRPVYSSISFTINSDQVRHNNMLLPATMSHSGGGVEVSFAPHTVF